MVREGCTIELTQDFLKSIFEYRDGLLYWKKPRKNEGKAFGYINKTKNYRFGCIGTNHYKHSRLVYLYHKGNLPKEIDHINNDPLDDRIENLREASRNLNLINRRAYGKVKEKNIYKIKVKRNGKTYTYFCFQYFENGKRKKAKYSKDLNFLIRFRNEFLKKNNPTLYKHLKL